MTDVRQVSLDVFNAKREKLCSLYDSGLDAPGQAHNIVYVNELGGWKELTFRLPYVAGRIPNFRWQYIKSELYVRLIVDGVTEWFTIHAPKKSRSASGVSAAVTCSHISSILKTRNLYLVFDDDNGIGTAPYLMEQILHGTGWTLGASDTFFESDGETEKVRSLKADGKMGAYKLIAEVCTLFNAYPVFDGDAKTVSLYSLNHKGDMRELIIGKDLDAVTAEYNSEDIVTRLYVEGEYGDDGYIGIDSVNPTGLTYLMNFDYYKEIGLFTQEHQDCLDEYLASIQSITGGITGLATKISELQNHLNELWGLPDYVLMRLKNGKVVETLPSSTALTDEEKTLASGDIVTVIAETGEHWDAVIMDDGSMSPVDNGLYAIKFLDTTAGSIGAKEIAIEAKEELIADAREDLNTTMDQDKADRLSEQIKQLQASIDAIYVGDETTTGLNAMMIDAAETAYEMLTLQAQLTSDQKQQAVAETKFVLGMGDILKDGYWNNDNYAVGQEQFLYDDAVEVLKQLSKPQVKYVITKKSLLGAVGLTEDLNVVFSRGGKAQVYGRAGAEGYEINMQVRVYDPEVGLNDLVYISKVTLCLDSPKDDTIEIQNEDIAIAGKTLDSILSRMTRLADILDQNTSLYARSKAINKDGSIFMERLEGQINILQNRLVSTVSSWYTDDDGNILFKNADGKSAMMLTGSGFMIANGKKEDGSWNWRTFGSGEGFTADAITTGYLSAERIEAHSIGNAQLSQEVTNKLGEVDTLREELKEALIEIDPDQIALSVIQSVTFNDAIDDRLGYRLEVVSTSDILSSDIKQTTLTPRVYKGKDDITDTIDESRFTWKRISSDTAADLRWNKTHVGVKEITLTTVDVYYSATYTCELSDE